MKPATRSTTVPPHRFLGAAGTVTGGKFLLTAGDSCLLVDRRLFQGTKEHRLRNWHRPAADAGAIKSVVLTHAHLDHSGHLPALCLSGFGGRVYSTPETYSLCRILLPDSSAADALRTAIVRELHWNAVVPRYLERVRLD